MVFLAVCMYLGAATGALYLFPYRKHVQVCNQVTTKHHAGLASRSGDICFCKGRTCSQTHITAAIFLLRWCIYLTAALLFRCAAVCCMFESVGCLAKMDRWLNHGVVLRVQEVLLEVLDWLPQSANQWQTIAPLCKVARRVFQEQVEGSQVTDISHHEAIVSSALQRISATFQARATDPLEGELVWVPIAMAACCALDNYSAPPRLQWCCTAAGCQTEGALD
jgi:hypothetical protein